MTAKCKTYISVCRMSQLCCDQSLSLTVLSSVEDAEVIYHDATALDLVDAGYAWIVTEQALLPHNTPIGRILCSMDSVWHCNK